MRATPTLDDIARIAQSFMDESGRNLVAEADALRPDLAGMRMYDAPLWGCARSGDPLFETLRQPEIVGPQFRLPHEWLPDAASVISFFLPYADPVVRTNRADREWPSDEWLHARIEGQRMINLLSAHLADTLREAGWQALAPSIHPDFKVWPRPIGAADTGRRNPTSNWSERHVAHVAGLGTFGLSHAFITRAGAAGRLGSVITSLPLPPTPRRYTRYDEYCTRCGACARRCPVDAIIPEKGGKDKHVCAARLDLIREKNAPRYGCGKCYVAVPCERAAPGRRGNGAHAGDA